jgi:hypothetical protein
MSYQEELAAMLDPDMIFFDKLTHSQVLFPLPVLPFTFAWRALTPSEHARARAHTTRHDTTPKKMRAVESLTMNLERLGYADWAHLPLLIGNFSSSTPILLFSPPSLDTQRCRTAGKQYSRRAEGIVVIPYNFTVPRYWPLWHTTHTRATTHDTHDTHTHTNTHARRKLLAQPT